MCESKVSSHFPQEGVMTFAAFLASHGVSEVVPTNGETVRWKWKSNSTPDGYAWARLVTVSGKTATAGILGSWKTGEEHAFEDSADFTPTEMAELQKIQAEMSEKARAMKAELQAEAAVEALRRWQTYLEGADTLPYFTKKGLTKNYGARSAWIDSQQFAVIPVCEANGYLTSLQYISPQGDKRFMKGGKLTGCSHWVGPAVLSAYDEEIYVCEGIATAATVHEATGRPVVVAFNSGNLLPVVRELRVCFPSARLVVAGDNDVWTEGNPGVAAAVRCAAYGCAVKIPDFSGCDDSLRPTDFNDLQALFGLESVRAQLTSPEGVTADVGAAGGRLSPGDDGLPPVVQKPGAGVPAPVKRKVLNEIKLARILLHRLGDTLVTQGSTLWRYTGTHWVELDSGAQNALKNELSTYAGDSLKSREVDSVYRTFLRYVPSVPHGVNLFVHRPDTSNYLDGTVHLTRNARGTYAMELRPHRAQDFITTVLPMTYQGDPTERNSLLDALLDEALANDPDKEGKIAQLEEMGGAMIMPSFSQMYFLHGVSGSRKSTIAKVMLKMLGPDNTVSLDPSEMDGFMLSGMIGKLVNFKLDIQEHKPLNSSFVKNFEDCVQFLINRKNKDPVMAMLPLVHLFAANKLPPNFDQSRAQERRLTLIEFFNNLTNDNRKGEIKQYEDVILAESRRGVLNFMLRGLNRLVANGGKFTQLESGLTALRAWQAETNPVAQFIDMVREGEAFVRPPSLDPQGQNTGGTPGKETQLLVEKGLMISRVVLFEAFRTSALNANLDARRISNRVFFKALRQLGFGEHKSVGVRYVTGIGVAGGPGAHGPGAGAHGFEQVPLDKSSKF